MTDTDKTLAFVVNVPEMVNHYAAIWRCLDPAEYDVVATADGELVERLDEALAELGTRCTSVQAALDSGTRYRIAVSHYDLERMEQVPLSRLADRQARLMYSYGKTAWNTSAWNARYDLFLVFGPVQAEMLAPFPGRKVQVGYPRFDKLFDGSVDVAAVRAAMGCSADKKTVVWLPTWRSASSIDMFAAAMAMLGEDYDVIVKPHPNSFDKEPERIELLRGERFTALVDDTVDSVDLYAIADYVVCDYGGPAFGAIYSGKPLVLLNVPGAEQCWTMGPGSLETQLRQAVPSLDFPDPGALRRIFDNSELWAMQRQARAELAAQLFAPLHGVGGQVAALALRGFCQVPDVGAPVKRAAGF